MAIDKAQYKDRGKGIQKYLNDLLKWGIWTF